MIEELSTWQLEVLQHLAQRHIYGHAAVVTLINESMHHQHLQHPEHALQSTLLAELQTANGHAAVVTLINESMHDRELHHPKCQLGL